ncbi:hypothetical protein HDU67_000093 [Dinochytrium kinnereticum]|nr:hypothetical protein HDU67_000093 [Dinochytrium kinnereticum]
MDDDFLDDVLEDFAKPDLAEPVKGNAGAAAHVANEAADGLMDDEFAKQLAAGMEQLMKGFSEGGVEGDMSAGDLKTAMDQLLGSVKSMSVTDGETSGPVEASSSSATPGSLQTKISETLNKLRDSSDKVEAQIADGAGMGGMGGLGGLGGLNMDDPNMEQMMKELEGLMGSGDFENMFEGIMEQIMSKDLLYEPMKDLAKKYPEWLEANKGKISSEDLGRYQMQQSIIQDILKVYDAKLSSDDENKQVIDLMQKMQECGNPPEEIMQELAPGLELGADGLPKIPNPDAPQECAIM